jgi:hypothetical protein
MTEPSRDSIAPAQFFIEELLMKLLSLSFLATALLSFSALAVEPTEDARAIAQILLRNPEVTEKLRENGSTHLSDYVVKSVDDGVNYYELTFIRSCHCIPSTALVKVTEDTRPARSDGPVSYETSVEIRSGR